MREQTRFAGADAPQAAGDRAVSLPSPAEIPGIIQFRGTGEEELWNEMVKTQFTSFNSEIAITELSRLGCARAHQSIRSGWIHRRAAEAGRVMRRGYFRTDPAIGSLANLITANAIVLFQELAIAGTGWKPDGGASMATYFARTCDLVAGKARRQWQPDYDPENLHAELPECHPAPLEFEEIRRLVWEMTGFFDDEMCKIIHLRIAKFSYEDIAMELGTTARAVEGKWARFLKKARKEGHE